MKQRIHKLLAAAGVASRRAIEEMVRQGRVAVNGKVMTTMPVMADPDKDRITVDDEVVRLSAPEVTRRWYMLLNKPVGVYCTNVAQGAQRRAIDLLPPDFPARLYPVGRLEHESRGLLLLTNDGELTNLLTHPRYGVSKTYRCEIDGQLTPEDMTVLMEGMYLIDRETGVGFKTAKAQVRVVNKTRAATVLEIIIGEGRDRQIRRVMAKLGHKVRDLYRVQMGPLTLKGLPSGSVRPLTPAELAELRSAIGKKRSITPRSADSTSTVRGPRKSPAGGPPRSKGKRPGSKTVRRDAPRDPPVAGVRRARIMLGEGDAFTPPTETPARAPRPSRREDAGTELPE